MDDDIEEFDNLVDNSEIVAIKDENGNKVEFAIIDGIEHKANKYLLVIEIEFLDDDEIEATILKEVKQEDEEIIYSLIEDDDEFNEIIELFRNSNEDYIIEF